MKKLKLEEFEQFFQDRQLRSLWASINFGLGRIKAHQISCISLPQFQMLSSLPTEYIHTGYEISAQ